jgi:hypothetical protein
VLGTKSPTRTICGVPATLSIQCVDVLVGFAFGTTEEESFPAKYPNAKPPKSESGSPIKAKDIEPLDSNGLIEDRDKEHQQCKRDGYISPTPPVEHPNRIPTSAAYQSFTVL